MTYGVYSEDLHYCSLSEVSLESAKKYLKKGSVVCSEKQRFASFEIRILFHKWRGFRFSKYDSMVRLGFISIDHQVHRYTWADKIVCGADYGMMDTKAKEANDEDAN